MGGLALLGGGGGVIVRVAGVGARRLEPSETNVHFPAHRELLVLSEIVKRPGVQYESVIGTGDGLAKRGYITVDKLDVDAGLAYTIVCTAKSIFDDLDTNWHP